MHMRIIHPHTRMDVHEELYSYAQEDYTAINVFETYTDAHEGFTATY